MSVRNSIENSFPGEKGIDLRSNSNGTLCHKDG